MTSRRIGYAVLALLIACGAWALFRPDPAPADGRVHVRYWEKWTGFEAQAMQKVVDAFNARQSHVKVDYLSVSNVDQKMLLATAGGNPPDVAGLWDYNVVVYADNHSIRPLDDFCRRDGISAKDYLPAYWEICRHDNHTYAMPTTPASVALHWNRRAFREVGLDPDRPPRTIEELNVMADKLTKRDAMGKIIRMGFMPPEPGWWNWGWGYFFGGKLWDGKDRVTMVTPENIRAFQWVKHFADENGSKNLQLFKSGFGTFASPQNAFLSGQVAMEIQGVWMANYIHNNAPSMDWDAAPFPYPADRPDLKDSTPVGLDVLVIPTGARHPEAAWEFIRFVQSEEGMEMLCNAQWKHSPLSHVSPGFIRNHKNKRIKLFYELAASKNTFRTPPVGIWREWQDEMSDCFDKIWTVGEDPREALQYTQDRVQPKLTRYLENLRRNEKVASRK